MPASQEISGWTTSRLTKFILDLLRQEAAKLVKAYDELTVTRKLTVADEVRFMQGQATAVAGVASALPATPDGYIKILDPSGNVKVIPYYKPS